ncbi:MAG: response regulator [Chloroflexi bacterium]|nr:response regulator [Chloroflexota bacterium]
MTNEGRILLVEDQREWQVELKDLLRDYPYSIKVADSLQKASDLLKHHVYDLVLLDLRLKDWEEGNFEGWQLMDSLAACKEEQGTQTIIISAYGQPTHVRDGFKKYHIADYFDKKHLDPQGFQKAVADAIEQAYEERGEILDRR